MGEKFMGHERRRHSRLIASFVVSYRIKEIPNNSDLTQTKNVGQGGLLLTTNKKFDKGTLLAVTIRFPFAPQKIELTGRVIESKEVARDLIYETRMCFLDSDEDFFRQLGKFVETRLKR
ncbi:MAG: PilZ domain-containing protein [Candidatus Omnitrophota bacterium]